MKVQLSLFCNALREYSGRSEIIPQNWFEAFEQLRSYLLSLKKKQIVVFLDELPWMDTPKSNFLTAFSHFWNTWASTRDGLKMVVCGSSTSWMLEKIIGDKGGLYGRSSRSIYIAPFNLHEVDYFVFLPQVSMHSTYLLIKTSHTFHFSNQELTFILAFDIAHSLPPPPRIEQNKTKQLLSYI